MREHLEDSLLECTMQDLLRYDDYNNDGHLSLHEFYTAFRESFSVLFSSFPHILYFFYKQHNCLAFLLKLHHTKLNHFKIITNSLHSGQQDESVSATDKLIIAHQHVCLNPTLIIAFGTTVIALGV